MDRKPHRRAAHVVTTVAILTCGALVSGACTSAAETGEVSSHGAKYGATLETSTTVPADGSGLTGSGASGRSQKRTDAAESVLKGLTNDPALLQNLDNLTPAQLEELTGMDSAELGTLGITPATVGALGGLIDKVSTDSGSNSPTDQQALTGVLGAGSGALLTSTGQLTGQAAGILASLNIDPATFATLVATALTVPEGVTKSLGTLLAVVDPNGLGQFQGDKSSLALIAVIMGAVLGRDPVALGQLANAGNIDPRFAGVAGFIANLATTLSPQFVDRINNITGILGPYAIRALGTAFALLERPDIGAVFEKAFSDPETVATAFGAALLFIPGLPELVAPNTFGDPFAIYPAVLGISAVALLNADAPGFRDFLKSIGVKIPDGV